MATELPEPLLERLEKAKRLLGDPSSGLAGNPEVQVFVEGLELTRLLAGLLLDESGEPRRDVSPQHAK